MMSDLFIVGASVRAAAASALRAGFRPWCIDLFGDADLVRACPVRTTPLAGYVRAMTEMLQDGPPGPWMYTGGFENHPSLGSDVSRPLLGNSSHGVLAVRNPSLVAEHLAALGFHVPRIHPLLGGDRRWLVKPYRGSGGLEVRMLTPGQQIDPEHAYLQEFIAGVPVSAVCIGHSMGVTLVGGSRQLIGTSWLHAARPFQYAGSIGPLRHPPLLRQFQRLGETLAENFFLRGLFGIDAIYDGARVWPIEVNPRYTASVEVLERATGRRLLADHAAAFVPMTNPTAPDSLEPWAITALANKTPGDSGAADDGSHGKAILFAEHDIIFPNDGPWLAAFDHSLNDLDVPFADIPMPGHLIQRGDPVLTFFARGRTSQHCEAELRKIAADLDRVLFRR